MAGSTKQADAISMIQSSGSAFHHHAMAGSTKQADAIAGAAVANLPPALARASRPKDLVIDLSTIDTDTLDLDADRYQSVWHDHLAKSMSDPRRAIITPRSPADPDPIRIAQTLRGARSIGSVLIADRGLSRRSKWNWPMSVGYLPGTIGERLAERLDQSKLFWIKRFVETTAIDNSSGDAATPSTAAVDILVVAPADIDRLSDLKGVEVGALIVVGDEKLPRRFARAVRRLAKHLGASAVVVPGHDSLDDLERWFERLVEHLSHLEPLDVAVGWTTETGVVVAHPDAELSPLNHLRHQLRRTVNRRMSTESILESASLPFDEQTMDALANDEPARAMFDQESGGAAVMASAARAAPHLISNQPRTRLLEASVFEHGTTEPIGAAFARGRRYDVRIWVGLGTDGQFSMTNADGTPATIDPESIDPARFGASEIPADIFVWAEGTDMAHQQITIGAELVSDQATFDITVPTSADDFAVNVALAVNGRIVQSGALVGSVTPNGGPPRRPDPTPMAFVLGPELLDLASVAPEPPAFTLIEHAAGAHSFIEKSLHANNVAAMQDRFDRCIQTLSDAQAVVGQVPGWLKSAAGATAFTQLAVAGADAFHTFVGPVVGNEDPDATRSKLQVIIDAETINITSFGVEPGSVLAEFFYDRTPPVAGAKWCDSFDEALTTGTCPTCEPWDPDKFIPEPASIPICPVGFWGMRKVIERSTVEHDDAGRPLVLDTKPRDAHAFIGDLDEVAIGLADEVDRAASGGTTPSQQMIADLAPLVSVSEADLIRDWVTWHERVSEATPQVLALLAHSDNDALHLGTSNPLARSHIVTPTVRSRAAAPRTDDGPIVLLMGCNTATIDAGSLTSFATKFRHHGAAVVVATIAVTLGRFAAPLTAQLIANLVDPTCPDRIGKLLLDLRRTSVARGWVTGLLLTSYGAADYALARPSR